MDRQCGRVSHLARPATTGFDARAIILQEGSSGPIRGATAFRLR